MVVFSIGETALPAVAAQTQVTPFDIAIGAENSTAMVINIARLVQSLGDAFWHFYNLNQQEWDVNNQLNSSNTSFIDRAVSERAAVLDRISRDERSLFCNNTF